MAFGSANELEYYCLLAGDLGFLGKADQERLAGRAIEVKRMLTALLKRLTSKTDY